MYLLKKKDSRPIIVVGIGLIGVSVVDGLYMLGYEISDRRKIDWSGSNQEIVNDILSLFDSCMSDSTAVVWCAGKCGFNSLEAETKVEELSFFEIIAGIDEYLKRNERRLSFYLVSSIGGLFENQLSISSYSRPEPLRPYGRLKQTQEKLLLERSGEIKPFIFRLSSVYGEVDSKNRMGLIQVLIDNGIKNKTSKIFGTQDTLRDYTFVKDVSRFICNVIVNYYEYENNIFHLANGKPSSIKEIKEEVENKLKKKLLLSYDLNACNDLNIVCKPNSYGGTWLPSQLSENIRKIYDQVIN